MGRLKPEINTNTAINTSDKAPTVSTGASDFFHSPYDINGMCLLEPWISGPFPVVDD